MLGWVLLLAAATGAVLLWQYDAGRLFIAIYAPGLVLAVLVWAVVALVRRRVGGYWGRD